MAISIFLVLILDSTYFLTSIIHFIILKAEVFTSAFFMPSFLF